MIKEAIKKAVEKGNFREEEIETIFSEIMSGEATSAQIAAFITALSIKGETVEEITGAARAMKKFAAKIRVDKPVVLDTCGTGGDKTCTFNISTLTALVASAAGITVAKHGNRSISSKCGSADLLEKLGVNINADLATVEKCVNEIGIGFMFAPNMHPAMKHAAGARREIGIRTIFNILGPLTNPANAGNQLIGIFDQKLIQTIAKVLDKLGSRRAVVVSGADGMDEVSTTSETFICELKDGKISNYKVTPEQFGFKRAQLRDLQAEGLEQATKIAAETLSGKTGPVSDIVLLNSAFAIYAAGKSASVQEALPLAEESLTGGRAKEKLDLLIKYSNAVNPEKNNFR